MTTVDGTMPIESIFAELKEYFIILFELYMWNNILYMCINLKYFLNLNIIIIYIFVEKLIYFIDFLRYMCIFICQKIIYREFKWFYVFLFSKFF